MVTVSWNRTATLPLLAGRRSASAVLLIAVSSAGMTAVTENTALRSGSSQHGNARRASVASNWVVAMPRFCPVASSKVLR